MRSSPLFGSSTTRNDSDGDGVPNRREERLDLDPRDPAELRGALLEAFDRQQQVVSALGPLLPKLGNNIKGIDWNTEHEYEELKSLNHTVREPDRRDVVVRRRLGVDHHHPRPVGDGDVDQPSCTLPSSKNHV